MSYQNLFVAKLPRNVNDSDLERIFANYNPINAKVMLDASTGKSKGFGFVYFNSEEEGEKAYSELNHRGTRACRHNFNLVIYPSQHSGKAAASACPALYIRNIPVTVPQHQVKQFLSSFGNMVYCAMREDHYGNPVWVVYAEYDSVESAKNALEKLHGSSHHFRGPPVMVKYADSEEAKRERRRRREEGKVVTTPVLRNACIFPPPRPKVNDANSTEAVIVSPDKAKANVGHNNSAPIMVGGDPARTVSGIVASSDSLLSLASLGHIPSSGTSSSASSVHKSSDAILTQAASHARVAVPAPPPVYFEPPALHSPIYPVEFVYPILPPPEPPAPTAKDGSGALNMIVLDDGQRLLVSSNAVNMPPANPNTWPPNAFGWPMEPNYNPSQMQIKVVPPIAFMPV